MSDPKDFVAGIDSDQRRSPTRVILLPATTRQGEGHTGGQVQTFPEVLVRAALAIELLAIALVLFSLFFNAPLEGIADPTHTPNGSRRRGTSFDCRNCCTTSRRYLQACWCPHCSSFLL